MRPSVTLKCPADVHANKQRERIVEIFDHKLNIGCLIQLCRMPDSTLRVTVYRKDAGVVVVDAAR